MAVELHVEPRDITDRGLVAANASYWVSYAKRVIGNGSDALLGLSAELSDPDENAFRKFGQVLALLRLKDGYGVFIQTPSVQEPTRVVMRFTGDDAKHRADSLYRELCVSHVDYTGKKFGVSDHPGLGEYRSFAVAPYVSLGSFG